jgi:hypothetical protein
MDRHSRIKVVITKCKTPTQDPYHIYYPGNDLTDKLLDRTPSLRAEHPVLNCAQCWMGLEKLAHQVIAGVLDVVWFLGRRWHLQQRWFEESRGKSHLATVTLMAGS